MFTVVLVYVDDVVIIGNDDKIIATLKSFLNQHFYIKDLGPLKYFLGIEVARSQQGICLSQRKYTLDIFNNADLLGARLKAISMEQNIRLNDIDGVQLHNPTMYRQLVGQLIYFTITRLDIVYSVHILNQFMN